MDVYFNEEYSGNTNQIIYKTKGRYKLKLVDSENKIFIGNIQFPSVNNHHLPLYSKNDQGVFSLFEYEFNSKLQTSTYTILKMGAVGFSTSLAKIRNSSYNNIALFSPFINIEFSTGGALTRLIDMSIDCTFDYSWNFGEDTEDSSKNKDDCSEINYFVGAKLKSRAWNGILANLFVKMGYFSSNGEFKPVLSDHTYGSTILYGTGNYVGISFGINIFNTDNQMLRLWYKPILANLVY